MGFSLLAFSSVYYLCSVAFSPHCPTLSCFSSLRLSRSPHFAFHCFIHYRIAHRSSCFLTPKKEISLLYVTTKPCFICFPSSLQILAFSNRLLSFCSLYLPMPYAASLHVCLYALITYKYHKIADSLVVRFSLPYNTCWFSSHLAKNYF